MKLYLDFETKSEADLLKVGTMLYAEHFSSDILCLGYSPEQGIFHTVKPYELNNPSMVLRKLATDESALFIAHNAFFDRAIWENIMVKKYGYPSIPIERWRCTYAKCLANGLPGSLKNAAIALRLPIQKDMEGRDNMLSLSKPRRGGKGFFTPEEQPEKFQKLYDYCKTDIEVMRMIDETLPDLSPKEQKIWFIDQRINNQGIKVDIETVKQAIDFYGTYNKRQQSVFRSITGGIPNASSQRAKLKAWCESQGFRIPNTQKATVTAALVRKDVPPAVRTVLETCLTGGKTSIAKYSKMLKRANENGQVRELLQYHGAHTGRWAGRGIQIQNFPRPTYNPDTVLEILQERDSELFELCYNDPATALSSMLRRVIVAPEKHAFLGADFSQIEARVLAWLAGQKDALEVYARGRDPYCEQASKIYGYTVTRKDKDQRAVGKVAVLALGFGGGIGAFVKMAKSNNLNLKPIFRSLWSMATLQERESAEWSYNNYVSKGGEKLEREIGFTADLIKQRWRNANKQIVSYWKRIEDAARLAIQDEGVRGEQLFTITRRGGLRFLQFRLPSGRVFYYFNPRIDENNEIIFEDPKEGYTKTYGGKLVENIVQAVARDIMAEAMYRLEERFPVAFTVHDELISLWAQAGFCDSFNPEVHRKYFQRIVLQTPAWAEGLPIGIECWDGDRYGK